MAKRKGYKLQKTQKTYSPIIGVLGGKHHTDYMPKDYGTSVSSVHEKAATKSGVPSRIRTKRSIFSKNTK